MPFGIAVPARDRRHEERERRHEDEAEPDEARVAIDAVVATAEQKREAEDEQDVPDDASREGAADDLGQAPVDREQRDDKPRGFPERRVEEAADAGAGVVSRVLRRLADQPRERDERERGKDEELDVAEVEEEACGDRDRREAQQGPEDLSRHMARLQAMLRAVLFDWGDTLMQFEFDVELVEAGHRAGIAALGRDGDLDIEGMTEHFRKHYLPLFWVPGPLEAFGDPGVMAWIA